MGKKLIVVAFVFIVIAALLIWSFYNHESNHIDDQLLAAFSEVHDGKGVSQAAAFAGSGPHPIVLLTSSGGRCDWTDSVPLEWRSENMTDIQLVVTVGEEQEIILGSCDYTGGPSITRYQYSVEVNLREANTGKIVASTTLYGSEPRHCGQTEERSVTRLEGSRVQFDQLEEWLRQYVAP